MSGVDVAVVGSCNIDLVAQVPRHPRPGETVLGTRHFTNPGGKGANQAVAAARLGATVAMVARVGDDGEGRQLLAALRDAGVDTAAVATGDTPTGIALITVDDAGENAIVVSPGANDDVDGDDIAAHRELLAGARVCLLQLEIPDAAVTAAASAAGGRVVLNPAPARDLPDELLAATSVLVPNASELALLAGGDETDDVDVAVDQARGLGFDGAVVVTLGPRGAVVVTAHDAEVVAAPTVDAVDTTAAGDAACGALAGALAGGADLRDAVEWGVLAGACAVQGRGAQQSLPTRADVEALRAQADADGGS